jgi:hypothetical protein
MLSVWICSKSELFIERHAAHCSSTQDSGGARCFPIATRVVPHVVDWEQCHVGSIAHHGASGSTAEFVTSIASINTANGRSVVAAKSGLATGAQDFAGTAVGVCADPALKASSTKSPI